MRPAHHRLQEVCDEATIAFAGIFRCGLLPLIAVYKAGQFQSARVIAW
jgi:hypothetical protein